MKKPLKFICIFIVILLVLFAVSVPVVNNRLASKVADELKALPLPESSTFIDSVSKAGKLVGNGNGMQFFGAILIKSELSLEDLNKFYETYRKNEWDCIVKTQTGQNVDLIEHINIAFDAEFNESGNYYIVYSWGDGIEPFASLDIRGH